MNNDDIDILNLSEAGRAALARIASLEAHLDESEEELGAIREAVTQHLPIYVSDDDDEEDLDAVETIEQAGRDLAKRNENHRRDIDAVTATKRTLEAEVARLGNDAARLAMERDAARAEVSDLIAMLDGMQSMLTQAGRVVARAEADHVATIDRLRQAERERDEVGLQFIAARERLALAMAVVEAARVYRDEDEVYLDRALAALDDVPGDVKAP
jgi:chromosome segregation ATPase